VPDDELSGALRQADVSSVEGGDLADPLQPLSDREREVLDLLASGLGTKEIGRGLYLSPKTVRNHIANIVGKLGLADRAHAIAYARQAGLGTRRAR
jgi:DNA-binding NarL/FixJ family response regulator